MMKSQHAPRAPNPVDVHMGTCMRLQRKLLKMSQKKPGNPLGVTLQHVQKYKRGVNRNRLWKISEALGVPVSFFYGGLSDKVPNTEFGENNQIPIAYDFINSSDGVALVIAVPKIKNKAVRR